MHTLYIKFSWCRSLSDHLFSEHDYTQLLKQVAHSTPFNHIAWLTAAEKSLEKHQQLHLLLGHKGSELVLCLPLIVCCEKVLGLPIKTIRHLGYPLSDRIALAVRPNSDAVLEQALAQIRKTLSFSRIQLSEITSQAAQVSGLKNWNDKFWFAENRVTCACPAHQISEQDRIEPSGNIRYKLRKARKRAEALPATIERITPNATNVLAVIDTISEVEQLSWKGKDSVGIFSGALRQQWMTHALSGFAETQDLRVLTMSYAGRCISYRLGFFDKGRIYDYNLAFLPEYASLGSGRLLLDEWIQWGLDEGWQWIDASRVSMHDSSHQLHERCTDFIEHRRWSFYSMRPTGLVLGLSYKIWTLIKPLLKARNSTQKGDTNE